MLRVDALGGGLDRLRGSGHQDHNVLDTAGWTTQSARNGFSLADNGGHGGKNTPAFIRIVCPSSTHTDWWVLSCDYPTCSDGQKQQMGLRVRLYITSDDISTYHYPDRDAASRELVISECCAVEGKSRCAHMFWFPCILNLKYSTFQISYPN